MDGASFDALTRRASLLAAGAAGIAAIARSGAAQAGKKGKKCKKPKSCLGRPNDAPCQGTGKCFQGACVGRPVCDKLGATCSPGNSTSAICCSGTCVNATTAPGVCGNGGGGRPCHETSDCQLPLTCVGYRCLAPVQ